jgi:hypothetical protein
VKVEVGEVVVIVVIVIVYWFYCALQVRYNRIPLSHCKQSFCVFVSICASDTFAYSLGIHFV